MAKLVYNHLYKKVIFTHNEVDINEYLKNFQADEEVFKYMQFIENQQMDGITLEDLFLYNKVPLYYFERHAIYYKIKSIFVYFMLLKNLIDTLDEELTVETDDRMLKDISEDIFNLSVKFIEREKQNQPNKKIQFKVAFKLFIRILKGIKSYIKFRTRYKNSSNIVAVSNVININKIKNGDKQELIDTQLGILIKSLKNNYNIYNIQCMFSFDIIEKSIKYKEDYIPFEFFILAKKLNGKSYIEKSLISDNLEKLSDINYTYNSYDFKNIMLKYIFSDIKERYIEDINEMVSAQRLIRKYKIKKCIAVDEGDRPREFIMAANLENIDTYAVQHGIINSISPSYIINSKYKDKIIPNYTFVWGKKYKDILVNNTNIYTDDNVQVVGQLRTDLLKNYVKEDNDNEKIKILYATQYLKDLLEPATEMLFSALSNIKKDYELIIKLHPADYYYDTYNELIKKYNIKNVQIVKDGDLYEIISWCDVIVSVHSTVVIEGALMNKSSICILLPEYNDNGGFVRDGISLGVKDKNELQKCLYNIKNYTFDDKFKDYIESNFYKVDGMVINRILDIVEKDD